MEKTLVASGKTIDLAIESALSQLGLDRDSVSVQVLQQAKSGFLGFGAQPAKVQVTYEAPDPVPEAPKVALSSASRKAKPAAPVAKPEESRPAPARTEPVKPAEPKAEASKAEPVHEAKSEAPKAEHMDSRAVPHCWKEEGNAYQVELVGDDLGYLIGRRGDTLDAIQHLCNYAVNREVEGHIRVNVDAESYRQKREESLRRYARKKAQQVLKARRRTTLEPMNAYERHVIHAALQDMENITTHSTGVEPNRCVVIEYVR